ncbi:MAG: hypothetical protein K6T72_01700 [Anoxybacillus sp.]|nr:hypothetical protein [Anoxybacillus sp.]MCL6585226.1 hypothetical protein [Anoxybacillus sp.]
MRKILILLLGCMIMVSCSKNNKITMDYFIKEKDIVSIQITEGKTGKKIELNDRKKLKDILTKLNGLEMQKIQTREKIKGYLYFLTLKDVNGKKTNITILDNILKINEEYYEMINKVSVPEFEEYFISN